MAPCAIALQELINICCVYSIEIDLNFNATKSYCMIFTPRNYKRFIPPHYLNKLPVLYTDSIKYVGYTFSSTCNIWDDNDMLKLMQMLYCRSKRLVRLFSKCSKPVLLELCKSFCTVFYCSYFWTNYKKTTFSKIRVAYNNVYRKILDVPAWSQTATDGAWSSTTALLSGRDRPRCLCVLRLSGSEPKTRRTGSVATSLPSNSLLVARAGNVEFDRYPQLMLPGAETR